MSAAVFGKLPAHGDFIARGLDAATRDALDAWLAASLASARERLGDGFEEAWDQAPPWRFGAVEDGAGVAGAIAPSIDAVGRRFPILVLRHDVAPDQVAGVAEECETLLFEALGGGWDADQLAAAAGALSVDPGAEWPGPAMWWTEGGERFPAASCMGARPVRLFDEVLTMEAEA